MKTITGTLHFFDHEPHVVGSLIIDGEHFELAGVKRSDIRTEFKATKPKTKRGLQGDLFDENSSRSGERKRDLL